ncbi:hypothetical protein CEXT_198671 [Caerostris extrusa]|uniref:Uncharacterized protein n=1 Tax=Caerostris extrusa TaxID=172846 RepID=A0AAV4XCB4_CAEEX|nr:hypothetical protein CEXT_198671 [Caerostris extrusa]
MGVDCIHNLSASVCMYTTRDGAEGACTFPPQLLPPRADVREQIFWPLDSNMCHIWNRHEFWVHMLAQRFLYKLSILVQNYSKGSSAPELWCHVENLLPTSDVS